MRTEHSESYASSAIRLFARGTGLLISAFFLFLFIAETWDSHVRHGTTGMAELKPVAVVGLILMGLYILAMFLALKWEHTGTLVALGALLAFFVLLFLGSFPGNASGGFSVKGVLNPFLLIFWLPVILYLLCWLIEARQRHV